ncbi:MAG: fibronectin type III domain-containing protein [Gilvibacter sp.]
MRNTKKLLLLYVFFVGIGLFVGCKSDDGMPELPDEQTIDESDDEEVDDEEVEDEDPSLDLPSDFEITISDILYDSATISWSTAATDNTGEVLYAVFLNDEEVVRNLGETTFAVIDLRFNTTYEVKVVATNSVGETISLTVFETPWPAAGTRLLLERLNKSEEVYYKLQYNGNYQVVTFVAEHSGTALNYDTTYYYLPDGKIEKASLHEESFQYRTIFEYIDEKVHRIRDVDDYIESTESAIHTFTSETTMAYESYVCPYECDITLADVNVLFDSENRLTFYQWTATETPTNTFSFAFEYTAGNLTKVTDDDGNVWEFTFDNKNSFLTYSSYYPNDRVEFSGFLISLKNNLHGRLRSVPFINSFKNTNNPVTFSWNGTVYRTVEYEYNPLDYPSKVVHINDGIEQSPVTLSYRLAL